MPARKDKEGKPRPGWRTGLGRCGIAVLLVAAAVQGITPETDSLASSRLLRMTASVVSGTEDARILSAPWIGFGNHEEAEDADLPLTPREDEETDEPDEVCLAVFGTKAQDPRTAFLDPGHLSPALPTPHPAGLGTLTGRLLAMLDSPRAWGSGDDGSPRLTC
ncbi:hypothetical protein [Aquisphaera insulae]|uniref:hypothetical protein n=1 Tax=Aquisphaera insulae TaxID=2712864 RepID=UPI0013EB3CFD|nr:hypothetical protein [Aquisphaera insulae]